MGIDLLIVGFACVSLIVTLTTRPDKQDKTKDPVKEEQVEE